MKKFSVIFSSNEISGIFSDDCRGNKFYNSRGWRKLCAEIRCERHNECERCKMRGKTGLDFGRGLICHHIRPVRNFPSFAYSKENIMLLCLPCHSEIHDEIYGIKKITLFDNVTRITRKKKDKFSEDEKW